jgi:chlorinating enzyme
MPASTTAAAALRPRLSPAQVGEFRREGFLTYREPVLPAERFAGLCRHFERMLAELPPEVRPENMDVPHFMDTALFEWLLDDAVLDLVEPLLGPDIALFSSHFLCKPGGDGKRVPWHEDSAYWQDMVVPMEVVTVWLALDRSDPDNGCMRVIPRTHHNGYSVYEPVADPANQVFDREIRKQDYDASRAVDLVLDPNQASLHDGKLMHGSNPNRSARRRCGYTMRYVSTRSRLHPRCEDHHHLYLARGRDHAGNTYGDPTRSYAEKMRARGMFVKKGH